MTDQTTSPQRQREIITAAATARGSEIVGWAEDLDVSATKYAPADRPELRSWLDRHDEWDELIYWRTDRFVRKVTDFADMIRWAQSHEKNLASATEPFDLASPMGKAMAYLTAIFAEMEALAISERVSGAHDYLRRNGRWGGGKWPYGYKAVPNPDGAGSVLVVDADTAEVAREAVRRVIAGQSASSIAADFNGRGIPTPADHQRILLGKPLRCVCRHSGHESMACGARRCDCADYRPFRAPWRPNALFIVLRSESLLGHLIHNRATITGDDGLPLVRSIPLITETEWTQLQAALTFERPANIRTRTSSLLLHVAYCAECGAPLHKYNQQKGEKRWHYYRCGGEDERGRGTGQTCRSLAINRDELNEIATTSFLVQVGNDEIRRRIYQPGYDPAEQIGLVKRSLTTVRAEYDSGGYDYPGGDEQYRGRVASLSNKLKELLAEPVTTPGYIYESTGERIIDRWNALQAADDTQGQRRLMVQSGFKIYAVRTKTAPGLRTVVEIDPALSGRVVAAAQGKPVPTVETDHAALARVMAPMNRESDR